MRLPSSFIKSRQKRIRRVLRLYRKKAISLASAVGELPSFVRDSLNFDFDYEIEESDVL